MVDLPTPDDPTSAMVAPGSSAAFNGSSPPSLIADVITAYNGIHANQQFLSTADSALILAEERYRLEKHRYDVGTASGVTFFTLEDETGFVNVVVWKQVFDRHAALAKTAALLGVTGEIQRADGVIHLIAKSLWAPDVSLAEQTHRSRDFH